MKLKEWMVGFFWLVCSSVGVVEAATIFTEPILLDSRNYTLAVSSDHGTPVPSIGTNTYAWRSTVTCSVDQIATEGLTNWTCLGWMGSGSVPSEGEALNTGAIVLTNVTSSIIWNWPTYTVEDMWAENVS